MFTRERNMKKVLFATTALIASAGMASAGGHTGLALTGGATFGLQQGDTGDAHLHGEIDFNIVGSGELDNGLSFGASLDIDTEADDGGNNDGGDYEAYLSGDFGKVAVGDLDAAFDNIGIGDIGWDGLGVDDVAEAGRSAGGEADVTYTHSIGDFSFQLTSVIGVSGADEAAEGDFGIMLGYSFGDFSVQAAYDSDNDGGDDAIGVEVGYSAGDLSVAAVWAENDTLSSYGLYASYAFDMVTVSAAFGSNDDAATEDAYGIGFSYALGDGLDLAGGVAQNGTGETVWDLGVNMSF